MGQPLNLNHSGILEGGAGFIRTEEVLPMESLCITINENEALKYLGYKGGEVPQDLIQQISWCQERIREIAAPRWVSRTFSLKRDPDGALFLEGTSFRLPGKDIQELLADCQECILMAATLGSQVEVFLRQAQITDMGKALVLDSCASCAIENICDQVEESLFKDWKPKGLFFTDRFSPGYGDMPISCQRDFCTLLDTQRRIGLCVSGSGIMIPRKSVTAVIGLCKNPPKKRFRGCEHCRLFRTCAYRKEGKTCGKA